MATYKEIKGDLIERVATDPANPGVGDIWYNTTTGVLKGYTFTPDTWISGGNLGTGRYGVQGCGIQTAALAFGGWDGTGYPGPTPAMTEEYDGSSWSSGGSLNQGRIDHGAAGTQTAGLSIAGYWNGTQLTNVEKYDGSSWTNSTAYPTVKSGINAAGTQTAAIAFGGGPPPNTIAFKFDGSTWTATGSMTTPRASGAGTGPQTATLAIGGQSPSPTANVESFNGSTWSTEGSLNSAINLSAAAGNQTAALSVGYPTQTELYDGTSWSISPASSANAQRYGGSCGVQTSAVAFGGGGGVTYRSQTEEFTGSFFSTSTLTTS